MKVEIKSQENLLRELSIEVPAREVIDQFEKSYKSLQRTTYIEGHRKGKAPITEIRKHHAKKVESEVLDSLVKSSFSKAITETGLKPVMNPVVKVEQFAEREDLKYTAKFEVKPQIQIKKVEGLPLPVVPVKSVTDKDVELAANEQVTKWSTIKPVTEHRGVKNGDLVTLEFAAYIKNEMVKNSQVSNRVFEIGKKQLIAGFEEGLLGLKVNETRKLTFDFPKTYHIKEMAGHKVEYRVKLLLIQEIIRPQVNDEFLSANTPFKNQSQWKTHIKNQLEQFEKSRQFNEQKAALIKSLVLENPFMAPLHLVVKQKQFLLEGTKKKMLASGLNEAEYKSYVEKWDKDFFESATQMVKGSLLVEAVAEQKKLKATDKEIEAHLIKYCENLKLSQLDKLKVLNDSQQRSLAAHQIEEQKVVEYLLSKAQRPPAKAG